MCTRLAALGGDETGAPKLLVVLAHPDDETIAVGGRMEHLRDTRFVLVTDGAPRDGADAAAQGFATAEAYAAIRARELAGVLRHAGLPPAALSPVTLEGKRIPDKQARECLASLARAMATQIEEFQPDAVLTHPYEGGHPDHDACAFAVHHALQLTGLAVPVIEAPFYHRGPQGFTTGVFLDGDPGVEAILSPEQSANKRARLGLYASQAQTLANFGAQTERYRTAPAYEFTQPPHTGRLNYEDFGWGMSGEAFCARASDAQRELET